MKLVQRMTNEELVDHFAMMVAQTFQIIPDSYGKGKGNIAKFEKKSEVAKKEILKRLKGRCCIDGES